MACGGRDELREPERKAASAKLRYETEIAKATDLFTASYAKQAPDFLSRWEAQRKRVMEAFLEYKAATDAYLEAARRITEI